MMVCDALNLRKHWIWWSLPVVKVHATHAVSPGLIPGVGRQTCGGADCQTG